MKPVFIVLLLIFPSFIFSQSNYYPGYIIKNSGDTLKGFIDYRDWGYSPLLINFKAANADATASEYSPETIKGFQINGFEIYKSFVGRVSTNRNIFPDLPGRLDTNTVFKPIFLKQLVTGNHLTLFYNNEVNKDRFFITEQNQMPVELKYYLYFDQDNNQEVVHDLFKGQLNLYISKFNNGDKKLSKEVETLKFEKFYLENIVSEINNVKFLQSLSYFEGYILKNNGDTLKGYIEYKNWDYSPNTINFKTDKTNEKVLEFNPESIKGFQVSGSDFYISYVGTVSDNKNIFPDLPDHIDTTTKLKSIFLKQITTGSNITLYYNNEIAKDRFFIAEKNQVAVELKYYDYYDRDNNREVVHDLYKGQLKLYINKYKAGDQQLAKHVESVKFQKDYLGNIVDEINNIAGKKEYGLNKPNNRNKPSNIRFFVGAGINSYSTTFSYVIYITYNLILTGTESYSHTNSTIGPKFDFGLDIFTNPVVQQSIFRVEFSATSVNCQTNIPSSNAFGPGVSFNVNQSSLTITPQFLFNIYNKEKIKVYLGAGFALNLVSFSKNSDGNSPTDDSVFWGYFPIQAGLVLNKNFELSYTYSSFVTTTNYSIVNVAAKLNSSVGIKYLFK